MLRLYSIVHMRTLYKGPFLVYKVGQAFVQDNTLIHKAHKTLDWLERYGIWLIKWPPSSPDLSPIENLSYDGAPRGQRGLNQLI